jgi:membrane protease YdiL (CAAX protease family)
LFSPENPQREQQPTLTTEPQPTLPLTPDPVTPDALPTPPPPSAENPVWNGWDVLQIAALGLASLVLSQLLIFFGLRSLHPTLSLKELGQVAQNLPQALLAIAAQLAIYAVVAAYMVSVVQLKYHARFWTAIRWNWPAPQWMLAFGLLGWLVLLVVTLLGRYLPMPQTTPFEELFKHPRDAYLMSVFAITLGPLMEEIFFRGFLYPVLARRMGVVWGIFFTALPFGLIHMFQYGYAWGVVLLIFLMGVVCTAVRAATGSVASSFLVHVGYNATEMLLFAVATDGFRHMEKAGMLVF